ncbi:MAG: LTA synthase family protein [Lachnospiraceae bacterium]|nr:LTA synthase family protein [Lachnospiraceae bacterium]
MKAYLTGHKFNILRAACLILLILFFQYVFFPLSIVYPSNCFHSTFVENLSVLSTVSGESGYFSFGPYISLEKGDYFLTLYGTNECSNTIMDIIYSDEDGQHTLYEGSYIPKQKISFSTPSAVENVEFRIFITEGNGAISFDEALLTPKTPISFRIIQLLLNLLFIALTFIACECIPKLSDQKGLLYVSRFLTFIVGLCCILIFWVHYFDLIGTSYDQLGLPHILEATRAEWGMLLINILIIGSIWLIFLAFFGNIALASAAEGILLTFLSLVSINFYINRGESFEFTQFLLARDAAKVLGGYDLHFPIACLKLLSVTCLFCFAFYRKPIWKKGIVWRIPLLAGSVFLLTFTFHHVDSFIHFFGEEPAFFSIDEYYRQKGLALGLMRTFPRGVDMPEDYSKEAVSNVLKSYNVSSADISDQELPDIIYIQCESLFFPELVTDPYWSEDPYEELWNAAESDDVSFGYFISPRCGGGTCDVEYEVLTGYRLSNTGGSPFREYIREDEPNLVRSLDALGYTTTAIHPNVGEFFGRNRIYRCLGFQNTYFKSDLDPSIPEEKINGWYTDKAAYRQLMIDYEQHDPAKPYFAHVVTTQNHGSYFETFDKYGITLNENANNTMPEDFENYLNAAKYSAESLLALTEYFKQVDHDVILVFWGDHAPAYIGLLGVNETLPETTVQEYFTPFYIWNNMGIEFPDKEVVAAYNVTPYVLDGCALSIDNYFDFLIDNPRDNITPSAYVVHGLGSYDTVITNPELLHDDWLLQYDRMFGKQYSME